MAAGWASGEHDVISAYGPAVGSLWCAEYCKMSYIVLHLMLLIIREPRSQKHRDFFLKETGRNLCLVRLIGNNMENLFFYITLFSFELKSCSFYGIFTV